jgi:hypothetical protein
MQIPYTLKLRAGRAAEAWFKQCRMAVEELPNHSFPTWSAKKNRTVARVKAARTTTQEMARLYARCGADKMHSVGKEGEDRLAILSFTRSNLSLAAR